MAEIPPHCPYRAGDRVQMHGYPGFHVHHGQNLDDVGVTGFRGVVEGCMGATILTGTRDDGRPWTQEWGGLDRDLTPCHDARCGCCPHNGGQCRPDVAAPERARQAALALAAWWRGTGPDPRPVAEPAVPAGQLALFTAA